MKSILISIQPKWCRDISRGIKTVEVRRNHPKLKPPFKCYVYCTIGEPSDVHQRLEVHTPSGKIHLCNGFVMGEFTCTEIETFTTDYRMNEAQTKRIADAACLSIEEMREYETDPPCSCLYAWHIEDFQLFESPLPVNSFRKYQEKDLRPCQIGTMCEYSRYDFHLILSICSRAYSSKDCPKIRLSRPPQSWCYVDSIP